MNKITKALKSKNQKSDEAVFAYAVTAESIRAFAFADLDQTAELTVITHTPLRGLRSRKLKKVTLPSGKKAVTVEVDDRETGVPEETPVAKSAFVPDARARAILRGIELSSADLRDAGGAYNLEQVRKVMGGISRQAVDKKVREGSLLAVPGPSNHRCYPTAQFKSDGDVVDGLKEVSNSLPTKNPWAVLNFLVNPHSGLGGAKPIERLRAGAIGDVVAAAHRLGEQGS